MPGKGGGREVGFCEAERQHGGDTSVAVLTFSPLEPGCQHKPLGPDSSQTPELRWRNKGCFALSSLFPSATVLCFRKECKIHHLHFFYTPKQQLHVIVSTTFADEKDINECMRNEEGRGRTSSGRG